MIIQRIAALLQPGDILPTSGGLPRRVITQIGTVPGLGQPDAVVAYVARLGAYPPESAFKVPPAPDQFRPDALVDVEVPDLTPAQARAEELLGLLEQVVDGRSGVAVTAEARNMIENIRPKPPTLGEVLRALELMCGDSHPTAWRDSCAILDRARRAGLL